MTSRKKILIAAAVLLVLMAGGYLGARAYRNAQVLQPSSSSTLPDRIRLDVPERDDIVKVVVPSTGVQLEKKGDLWEIVPPSPIHLDQSAIGSILWSLGYMYAERIIDEAPENLADYGLDNPQSRTIITGSDGTEAEFFRGNRTPSGSGYYVMLKGDPKVYLVSIYSAERLSMTMKDIRDRTLSSTFELEEFRRFSLESGDFRIEAVPAAERPGLISELFPYVLTAPYVVPRELDSERFSTLFEALQNLYIMDFIDDAPASLEPYGLDKPVRVFLETGSAQLDLLLGNSADGLQYAKLPGEPGVFTINDISSAVRVSPFELAGKFAFIVNIKNVDSFTVRGNGQTLTAEIKRQGAGDNEVETYFLNGRQAVEKDFKAFYQTVIGLMVDAEYPNGPARGGNEEIAIEYNLNKPAGVKTAVKLIPYNRDFYALDRDGVVEFLVSRPQLTTLYQSVEKMTYVD
jgi:hypothetical protein